MKHSPALGINIPIAVWIDGRQAGAFAKGHVYERYLAPGRHTIYASRPSRWSDQYSLALTYYRLRAGVLPFPKGSKANDIIMMHRHGRLDLRSNIHYSMIDITLFSGRRPASLGLWSPGLPVPGRGSG